jgi:hypothetical protein
MALGAGIAAFGMYPSARAAERAAAPVIMTHADELKREMANVGVTSIPPVSVQNSPATYPLDDKVAMGNATLPDPLTMKNGSKVTSAGQWKKRRQELLDLLQTEVYGVRPKSIPKVTWTVANTSKGITVTGRGGGPSATYREGDVITKNLIGRVDNKAYPDLNVTIQAQMVAPANAVGVPAVIVFGGATFALPEGVPATTNLCQQPAAAAGAGRGGAAAAAPQPPPMPVDAEEILKKGWAIVYMNTASVQGDGGCGLTQGIIGLVNKGQPRSVTDWGVLSAWGWGASRVLDYLQTDKMVDAKRVAPMGASRNGKAALVGMALDDRFYTGFIASSGEGGAKLHRRKYGETVDDVATNYYFWMGNNFLKYAGQWDKMPVDSHDLFAVVAPRPVFVSGGALHEMNADGTYKTTIVANGTAQVTPFGGATSDAWVDPKGSYLAMVAAAPVYTLLGKKPVQEPFPAIDTPLLDSDMGFYQHTSGHTAAPAWPVFVKFAAKYWDAPAGK